MNFFRNLFRKKTSDRYTKPDIEAITSIAQRLADVINESLQISNNSNNPEIKISRLDLAKDKLAEIKQLSTKYSFLKLTTLKDVERSIAALEKEYLLAGYREIANGNFTDETQIATLIRISNGMGEYASIAFSDKESSKKNEKALEMLSTIKEIEKNCAQLKNSELFYSIAIAYRNYCAWFVRGEGRKQYLEKCVFYLTESLSIDPDNLDAKTELGRLLIEEKVIRNLSKGIKILEDLKNDGNMPSHFNSILSKAHRQSGMIELDSGFDLCSFNDPSPAVFREERKRFRALIKKYKKQNEIDKLKTTLNQYYNLAVLVTICYGDHDCNSGVIGWQYDEAIKTARKVCNKIDFSFAKHGFLEESNFISKNDWKTFVIVFGENSKSFNPTVKFKKDQ